ncbi:hypothetical protein RD792_005097 [Penstemon davidsonii]|uniref:CASP-like protein n=1 Tax=Penstemon davidsonii TaxID=160366 RepID=A0ABR0DKL5_9LAMI|nr:hypothetical protein RD792_005097 [Penstemon davidsonii]
MAPPPSMAVSPLVALIVRIVTFGGLLISVIVLATTTGFNESYAYRYMLASGVIGMAYTILQTALTLFYLSTGNRLGGDGFAFLDFFGDKVISYMLATGAAAGFGLSVDLARLLQAQGNFNSTAESFLQKANVSASLLFMGFLFSAISSVFSSLSLPKRVD